MQSKVTKNLSARFARAILLIIFPLVLASQVAQAQDTGNNDESEKVKQLEELKK